MSDKKGATGQSFIRKEIASYRIGTLDATMTLSQARVIEGHLQAKILLLQTLNLGKSMPVGI